MTSVLEDVPYVAMPADFKPSLTKHVKLVFIRKALQDHHAALKVELERLLAEVDKETDLIKEDNLAKGELVYLVRVGGHRRKYQDFEYWDLDRTSLAYPVTGRDPAEYWGGMSVFTRDFVSDVDRFPWMPVPVSQQKSPF